MKHAISISRLAIFLIIMGAHMDILSIMKANILVINEHVGPPNYVDYGAHNSNLSYTHVFTVSVLRSTPKHHSNTGVQSR
jgi:hypothetical protein